ncbi:hypothetical protein [Streptomyces brasiliscabiei]|uniref:hypothetical protein n=1 Tax=Streptomyces brasiliscabiei TaxID=2736302 RepID=UPI001C0F56F9|nr:hypothetical protein [Streptomyces brasiliscabiei]
MVRLAGLSSLQLTAPGIDAGCIARLAALRKLRHLEVEAVDSKKDGDAAHAFAEAIRELRVTLPYAEINGQWALPELLHLLDGQDQEAQKPEGRIEATVEARRRADGIVTAYLTLRLPERAHAFTPSSTEGLPISITLPKGAPWRLVGEPVFPRTHDARLTGTALIALDLVGTGDRLDLEVRVQVSEDDRCCPPTGLQPRMSRSNPAVSAMPTTEATDSTSSRSSGSRNIARW